MRDAVLLVCARMYCIGNMGTMCSVVSVWLWLQILWLKLGCGEKQEKDAQASEHCG